MKFYWPKKLYFDYFPSDIQYMFNLFIFSPTHEKKLSLNSVKLLSIIPLDPWSLHLFEILRYLYWLLKMVIKWLFIFEFYFFPTVCRNLWTMSTSFYRTHIHKNFCYFFKVLEIHMYKRYFVIFCLCVSQCIANLFVPPDHPQLDRSKFGTRFQ